MILSQRNTKRNTWAVTYTPVTGRYRAVVDSEASRNRNFYGDEILHTGLSAYDANQWLETYRSGVVVDLSDCLIWDTGIEETDAIQEFDMVETHCHDGILRTGQVIWWNQENVAIEVGSILYFGRADTTELIAKLEWQDEYDQWLDENYPPMAAPEFVGAIA